MRGKIFKLSGDEGGTREGACLGIVTSIEGVCELHTDSEKLREILTPMINEPIFSRGGRKDGDTHLTFLKEVKPSDTDFLKHLKFKLIKVGLWMEVED